MPSIEAAAADNGEAFGPPVARGRNINKGISRQEDAPAVLRGPNVKMRKAGFAFR